MAFFRLSSKVVALLSLIVLMHFVSINCFTQVSSIHNHVMTPSSSGRNLIVANVNKQTEIDIDCMKTEQLHQKAANILATCVISLLVLAPPSIVWADGQTKEFKFPPIDYSDKSRCVLKGGSSMGQANAARDKLYDLRQCKLSGVDASGYDLSGVIMTATDLSKANLKDAQFSKGYLQASNFDGADFSNAIVDRANFQGSSLRGTIFNNAVLTGTSFDDADLENADFTEAAIGTFDVRNLCKNPTLKGENPVTGADTRLSVGCK